MPDDAGFVDPHTNGVHDLNGTQPLSESYQPLNLLLRHLGLDALPDLLDELIENPDVDFFNDETIELLAYCRNNKKQWRRIRHAARRKVDLADLTEAVDDWLRDHLAMLASAAEIDSYEFQPQTAADILRQELSAPNWIIPDLLAEGLGILAGRPKKGKSWFVLDLAIAVSTGGVALGQYSVEQGDVLYLDLEGNPHRMQRRLKDLMSGDRAAPDRLSIAFTSRRLNDSLLSDLAQWIHAVDNPRLIIIDTLARIRPSQRRNSDSYQDDYEVLAALQHFAAMHGITVLLVHHTRKTGAEDIYDTIAGTTGIIGSPDTLMVIQRGSNEASAVLHVAGRDVEQQELALQFDRGFWTVLGGAEEYRKSQNRRAVLEALELLDSPATPKQVAQLIGVPPEKYPSIRVLMRRMEEYGDVRCIGNGQYVPGATVQSDVTGVTPVTQPDLESQNPNIQSLDSVTGEVTADLSPSVAQTDSSSVTPDLTETQGHDNQKDIPGFGRGSSGVTPVTAGEAGDAMSGGAHSNGRDAFRSASPGVPSSDSACPSCREQHAIVTDRLGRVCLYCDWREPDRG